MQLFVADFFSSLMLYQKSLICALLRYFIFDVLIFYPKQMMQKTHWTKIALMSHSRVLHILIQKIQSFPISNIHERKHVHQHFQKTLFMKLLRLFHQGSISNPLRSVGWWQYCEYLWLVIFILGCIKTYSCWLNITGFAVY